MPTREQGRDEDATARLSMSSRCSFQSARCALCSLHRGLKHPVDLAALLSPSSIPIPILLLLPSSQSHQTRPHVDALKQPLPPQSSCPTDDAAFSLQPDLTPFEQPSKLSRGLLRNRDHRSQTSARLSRSILAPPPQRQRTSVMIALLQGPPTAVFSTTSSFASLPSQPPPSPLHGLLPPSDREPPRRQR